MIARTSESGYWSGQLHNSLGDGNSGQSGMEAGGALLPAVTDPLL
jgi:hypothetical protein